MWPILSHFYSCCFMCFLSPIPFVSQIDVHALHVVCNFYFKILSNMLCAEITPINHEIIASARNKCFFLTTKWLHMWMQVIFKRLLKGWTKPHPFEKGCKREIRRECVVFAKGNGNKHFLWKEFAINKKVGDHILVNGSSFFPLHINSASESIFPLKMNAVGWMLLLSDFFQLFFFAPLWVLNVF